MRPQLEGKVALVTGGGSGIGKASALAFAREGAKVVIADMAVEAGEETVRLIEADGEALFIEADVSQAAEVREMFQKAIAAYGSIDCALNNAGVEGISTSIVACTEKDWDRVLNTNLKGVWLCMKYELSYMREQGGGSIVNMASIAGLRGGLVSFSPYITSKHGVVGLTKAAAVEYAKTGIRINAVCPGFIQTPMLKQEKDFNKDWIDYVVPAGRLGTPEEVAEAVVWLASDAASFVTGHALVVDGGSMAQ